MYDLELSLPKDAWFVTLKKMVSLCLLHQRVKDTSRFSIKDGWREEWKHKSMGIEKWLSWQSTSCSSYSSEIRMPMWKIQTRWYVSVDLGLGERDRRISRTYWLASLDSQWDPALIRDPIWKNVRNDWARHSTLTLALYGHVYMLVHTPTNVHEHKTHT